jgi:hypothetical protein
MIDAPSDLIFDVVEVHQQDKIYSYGKKICACTWHGCYINQGRLLPKINLKTKRNPDVKLPNDDEGRHHAIVSQDKKIAVGSVAHEVIFIPIRHTTACEAPPAFF